MYVACTRAMDHLDLFVPEAVWVRHLERNEPVRPSPFVTELPAELYDDYRETFGGGFEKARPRGMPEPATSAPTTGGPAKGGDGGALPMGYCRHAIYGRGKIIQHIPPDKYRVNFQDFGLKVIVGRFLEPEE
jgi:DNA helicase-2/ATP-dependent DNA helicase PcrA